MNRMVSARILEPEVWEKIEGLLKNPETLRQGYLESLEQQKATQTRQRAHLETLQRRVIKLEQQKRNLTRAYTDPDISLTKREYIEQKDEVDRELSDLAKAIAEVQAGLETIPTPAELESLEIFAKQVRESLELDRLTPEDKRKVLKMLHVKVIISPEGCVRIDGWFNTKSNGLSFQPC